MAKYSTYFKNIIIFFILFTPSILQANPSVDVPVRHWSYDTVEKLAILNLADIADIGLRPVSRIKMAYIIKGAIEKVDSYELDFDVTQQEYLEELLYDLIEEFRKELVIIDVGVAAVTDEGAKKYIFNAPELNVEKVYAKLDSDRALYENKDGWKLGDGFNLRIKLGTWAKINNYFAISLEPGIKFLNEDTDVDFENAHIRFSHPDYNMELAVGRSSMWWGPGFHGTLLLTDNAFPLDTVRFNNIYPFRLPWYFRKLGRFNGQIFVSRLEESRVIPNPWLCGWRVDYIPVDFLKLGFSHMLMFGGKGVKRLGFANFWSSASLVFSAAGGESETEDHLISADMQLFIRRLDRFFPFPVATGAKLYTEWGAEDEAGNVPENLAYITGAYFTDVLEIPGFDAKIEFADFHRNWYTHFRYGSGYTRRGSIIGHQIGGDSEEIALTGIFNSPNKHKMSITYSHQHQGASEVNVEITDELRIEFGIVDALEMYNIDNVDMDIFYELEDIENYNNTTGSIRDHIFGVEVRREF